ncbi:MAG: hypothetical protein K9I68_07755 [Bacteroidales bacterium]|nr:hypothetical protein [Bacteroidales bacterium]
MDLYEEKYRIIQKIINLKNKKSLQKVRSLIDKELSQQSDKMSLETFYKKIENSEKAYNEGKITSQKDLKKEIKKWGDKN